MHTTRKFIVSIVLMIAISQLALAVQVRNQSAPAPASVSTTGVVERGGTVTSFDLTKKTIVVDKVQFALNAMPVQIHSLAGTSNEKDFVLKPGMQIRFNTSKENFSAQDKVLEIWVTSLGGKPAVK